MKNCQSYRLLKIHKNAIKILVNIRSRVQAVSPKAYIGVLLSIHREIETHTGGVQRRVLVRIDGKLSK